MVGHEVPGTLSTAAAAAAVAAAAAAAAGAPISNSTHWSNEETKLLIKTWGEYREDFAEIKRNLSVWNKVLERLLKAGFFRSVEQCRNRWKFLETKYKTALKEFNNTGRTTWEFFEDMDEAKYGSSIGEFGRVRRNSSAQISDTTSEKQSSWSNISKDVPGRVQLPSIRATPAFAAAAAQVTNSSVQNLSPEKIEITQGRSLSPFEYSPVTYGHDISAGRSSLSQVQVADTTATQLLPSYGATQHSLSLDGLSTAAAAAAGDSRDTLRILATKRQLDLLPAGRAQSAGDLATATVAAISKQHMETLSNQQSPPTNIQNQKNNKTRKRKLDQDRINSMPEDNSTGTANNPLFQSLEALESGKVELVGKVRRSDILEFLQTQAAVRSQRTAEWAEERRRAEEQRNSEEWRFHEFQMAMVRLIQNSLAPYAVDSDEIAESPRSARTERQSAELSPNTRIRAESDPGKSHPTSATASGNITGISRPEDGEIIHTSTLPSMTRKISKTGSDNRSMSIESNSTSHSSWGVQNRA
ncbi:hypothetical protein COEREDRAFT_8609 [Coemansia reversa NRRL 1564]|uniref:Myb-like domain-containing protein n=1 Tax=Coemansia reversa (strain ATCC 12441 / NRRL 1564) TaxID=763665 RepID=A0A2G5BAZ1_COERN|nr:hypothetical protein COEREDRAFT_8609 [Coemansia reversa NRRL 1564]|eukprot:PIA16184.1 hypothetical protein COEREDRAFT_8609 [Coemansia reversa NRRL 1564]